jgi:hypothetical protein
VSVLLSRNRLTRVVAGTRIRSRCGRKGCSVVRHRHRLRADDLSIYLMEDLVSEPGASNDGVDPDDAPECVSMFVKTQKEKGYHLRVMIVVSDDGGSDVEILIRHGEGVDQSSFLIDVVRLMMQTANKRGKDSLNTSVCLWFDAYRGEDTVLVDVIGEEGERRPHSRII